MVVSIEEHLYCCAYESRLEQEAIEMAERTALLFNPPQIGRRGIVCGHSGNNIVNSSPERTLEQARRYITLSNGRLINPTPETLFAHDQWGKRDVERVIDMHEGIVLSLTPTDWELPGTLTLETLAVFGEFMADQIEASGQIGAMDEPDESATGIEEKRIFEDKLPTLAGKLIFPPVGWIDHQSHLLGPIANATEGRLTLIARWFWSIERSLQSITVWAAEIGRMIIAIPIPAQHCAIAPAYGRHPTIDREDRDCLGPNAFTENLQEIALRLTRLLRGVTANESLPLPTFGLIDSLLPDGIEYPVYSLVREKLKDALIVNFPNGDWATRLLSPELTANGCLPLFFVIALPNAIVDSWIQARTYQGIAANVLNHFPMKQLNCFMSLQGSITKLTHWMAQGHMESYWNDTLSFIAAPMPNAWFRPIAKQAHCRDTTIGTTRAGSIGQQPVQHFAQMKNCSSTALTMAQGHSQISHCRCEIRSLPGRYR